MNEREDAKNTGVGHKLVTANSDAMIGVRTGCDRLGEVAKKVDKIDFATIAVSAKL